VTWTAEKLFDELFAPLYPAGVRLDELRATDANPAGNPAIGAHLGELATTFARLAPEALGAPDLELALDDASVHRVSARLDRAVRDRWIAERDARGASKLAVIVAHGAVWTGACVVATRPAQASWLVRNPAWESRVRLTSRAGVGELAPFMWWLKSLSDEEIGRHTLGDRYRMHVEVPTFDAGALPVIAPPDRRIPRLAKVRYDTLHRHLRAHVPELRSVGDDFPSPERLAELGFAWLEGRWLGGGRMLLLHGPTRTGIMLLWLTGDGFAKSAYFEGDPRAPYVLDVAGIGVDDQKVRVIVRQAGRDVVHELMWWGS
jgi:hypothetical protein